ncbi:hypothetical protein FS749_012682 [Ceratobasidium sp. UAMH 11750]|nr:hypothetical protein FS749_012682 [Ceratobasidium sp. UAMH 11750]
MGRRGARIGHCDALISGPVEAKDGPTKNAGEGSSAKDEAPARKASAREASAKAKRSPSLDGRKGSTPPTSDVFQHIWPPPVLETKKGRKSKVEPEPVPPRSFITQRNLSVAPAPSTEEDTKDGAKDGSANKDAGSSLRSMLTTMPSRAVFLSAVQTFLAQPKRRGRAVVMTKALMKDALAVLLDPNTEEMLKDYVPPEQLKDEDKSSRGGTPAGRKAVDASDHTTLEFRAWAKRMFSTVKTARGEDALAFAGKPVVVEDDIYETIVLSHSKGNHCGAEETVRLVDQAHSWVPRALVEAFVQECPGCPASNKVSNTATKPKKRKWVRKEDKAAAATTRRKPATRRGKRGGQAQEAGKRRKGKEASPADESEGEVENENEEQEQELEGEQEQEQEQEQEMEEDELGEDVVQDEPEEDEMESEDEQVARPAATVASSVPMQDKMDVDESG